MLAKHHYIKQLSESEFTVYILRFLLHVPPAKSNKHTLLNTHLPKNNNKRSAAITMTRTNSSIRREMDKVLMALKDCRKEPSNYMDPLGTNIASLLYLKQ